MSKYISILNRHFNEVKGMTPYQLHNYFKQLDGKSEFTSTSILDRYSKIIQFFNRVYGYEHFLPYEKPITTKRPRDEMTTIFNKVNFHAWLRQLKTSKMHEETLMFSLMWELALRPSELLYIRFEDVLDENGKYNPKDRNLDNKSCQVHRIKTSTQQLIKISSKLVKLIYDYYDHHYSSYLASVGKSLADAAETRKNFKGRFMMTFNSRMTINRKFEKISKLIGRNLNPKDMRTSSLSYWVTQGGYDIAASRAGHKSSKTTKRFYIKGSVE